jgi:UDP-glucuronate 4-epimerase
VYGPWGRPDMAMYIFAENILKDISIPVFNHGKMKRDFTYIDDIISGTRSAMEKNFSCEIFNLGNNKSENLMDMIKIIETNLGKKAHIDFRPMQLGDVPESFADIDKSIKKLNYNPKIDIENGIPLFIDWYKTYHSS